MNVFCERGERITTVTLEGPFVVPKSMDFESFLKRKIEEGAHFILIDFAKVSYIDSSGISALLTLLKVARSKNGDIRFACINRSVGEMFEHIGLQHVFKQYATLEEGLESFDTITGE